MRIGVKHVLEVDLLTYLRTDYDIYLFNSYGQNEIQHGGRRHLEFTSGGYFWPEMGLISIFILLWKSYKLYTQRKEEEEEEEKQTNKQTNEQT